MPSRSHALLSSPAASSTRQATQQWQQFLGGEALERECAALFEHLLLLAGWQAFGVRGWAAALPLLEYG